MEVLPSLSRIRGLNTSIYVHPTPTLWKPPYWKIEGIALVLLQLVSHTDETVADAEMVREGGRGKNSTDLGTRTGE